MLKRLGKDADEAAASESQLHPEDELYAVPSDLQVRSSLLGKNRFGHGTICCMHALLHLSQVVDDPKAIAVLYGQLHATFLC